MIAKLDTFKKDISKYSNEHHLLYTVDWFR